MSTYHYDDFSITLTTRPDGSHVMGAVGPDGRRVEEPFVLPLSAAELQESILGMARLRSRAARTATLQDRPTDDDDAQDVTREVGASTTLDPADAQPPADEHATKLGAALATALFSGSVGAAYEQAAQPGRDPNRGLRLTLTLGDAPDLLSLPWEFLSRGKTFLASQRRTPLVRRLEIETPDVTPEIGGAVRILGVVASPADLSPLATADERRRVESAVSKMTNDGRVELVWLDPATPKRLREQLRDGNYHVLHFVGHSDFANGDGVIYLENEAGNSATVDSAMLANLLADQSGLRLVVLNSCEGARTTPDDPYAGVATTLIQLGIPAVVAMQFEISDTAAIRFAEELYTNLVARQDPIDAAVAEARKAIYVEVNQVEFATPVLFVRDPDVELFRFRRASAGETQPIMAATTSVDGLIAQQATVDTATVGTPRHPLPPPDPSGLGQSANVRTQHEAARRKGLLWAGAASIALVAGGTTWAVSQDDGPPPVTTPDTTIVSSATGPINSPDTTPATTPAPTPATTPDTTQVTPPATPRPAFDRLAVAVANDAGEIHLKSIVDDATIGNLTDRPGAVDIEPDWQPGTSRLAFTRIRLADGTGSQLKYAADGDAATGVKGKFVDPLIAWEPGLFHHAPAWAADGTLYWADAGTCQVGLGCAESIRRSSFTVTADEDGHLDELTETTNSVAIEGAVDITAIAAHPSQADWFAFADDSGVWVARFGTNPKLALPGALPITITYTGDGSMLVVLIDEPTQQTLVSLDAQTGEVIAATPSELSTRWQWITSGPDGATVLALNEARIDARGSRVAVLAFDTAAVTIQSTLRLPTSLPGEPVAIEFPGGT